MNKLCILLTSLLISTVSFAQDAFDNQAAAAYHQPVFECWGSLKLASEVVPNLNINAQAVMRTNPMQAAFVGNYYYLQARYRFLKVLYPDVQIRIVDNHFSNLYRLEFGLQLRKKIGAATLMYRTAYFNEYAYVSRTTDPTNPPNNYWRNRLGVKYDFSKKFDAYVSAETYTQFLPYATLIKREATIIGADYNLKGNSILTLNYVNQPDFHKSTLVWLSAICLGYEYDIPGFKKQKGHKQHKHDHTHGISV